MTSRSNLPNPKTSLQEVLRHLIDNGNVSIFDFPYLSGFRTRLSDLKLIYGLSIKTEMKKHKNKYNNVFNYAYHTLENKEKAIKLYLELVNK